MKKIMLAASLAVLSGISAFGQTTAVDDYKKSEFFVGFSNSQVDTGLTPDDFGDLPDDRESFNGFEVSGVYNFSRYLGVKGDFSAAYNNKTFGFIVPTVPPSTGQVIFDTNNSLYNFLGGVQVKDNATDARFKPFGHALIGAGHGRVKVKNITCDPAIDCTGLEGTVSETGFAGAFGGGLDIKLSDRFDLRAIQVDYNPIRFDNGTSHNVRFGIGLVFK